VFFVGVAHLSPGKLSKHIGLGILSHQKVVSDLWICYQSSRTKGPQHSRSGYLSQKLNGKKMNIQYDHTGKTKEVKLSLLGSDMNSKITQGR
jgi:hypothetical protein